MSIKQQYASDALRLLEAGFIAVNQTYENGAIRCFEAAAILDEENILLDIGYGYLHLCKLEIEEAEIYFKKALEKDENNTMAQSFLGIALSFSSEKGASGEKILSKMAKSDDNDIKNLASDALTFVDEYIKKK